jgi:hypothetical protein
MKHCTWWRQILIQIGNCIVCAFYHIIVNIFIAHNLWINAQNVQRNQFLFAPFGSIEAAQMTRVANFWKPLDTLKIKMCLMACANVQFRVQGQVVELESRYVTLSIKRVLKYRMGQLPPGNSYILSILMEKGWRLNGQKMFLIMIENFLPCTVRHKNCTNL